MLIFIHKHVFLMEKLSFLRSTKRIVEARWDNQRADNCEVVGDNFSSCSRSMDQEYASEENSKTSLDKCKRQKLDSRKCEIKVSVTHDTETSVTSVLTVGGEAFTYEGSLIGQTSCDFTLLGDKIIKLGVADCEFKMVHDKFYTGLGILASYATINAIFKNCHRSTSGQARMQAFQRQQEITRLIRGDSNVRYAWHGTSKQGVSVVVLHGFGQPQIPKHGTKYGIGVYLAPGNYSRVSAVYSDVDENGEQHMVLCRVIMGNMEQVEQGSEQFHPTSEDFDTGVDDICNPKRYVVWTTHMNTHILPEYIISFKLAAPWNNIIATLKGRHLVEKPDAPGKGLKVDAQPPECKTPFKACAGCNSVPASVAKQGLGPNKSFRAPRSPWMSFPMLFLVMRTKLSEEKMSELQQHYLRFKVGQMPRDELIKILRCIAGDRLLADSIRSIQAQERAEKVSKGDNNGCLASE
ncbi:hypothetical protein KP509_27G043800 [Ceratopteris richardii]|uniref:Poly [ADP-ribose] polymerase n=2 Tax=Ceratopteris richardii TaxID=49495 RepID=A0A8T2RG13_CERRI|nr:hypothetical protein KP509_27G043800 [Ceratopteris richardii]